MSVLRDAKENREKEMAACLASRPQKFARPFFVTVSFRVTHDELSERGTTRN